MRVIAGTAKSLPLKTPNGPDTRPTTDRIKETLFNMLQTEVPGCVFADLFAGSGGIGIEAISRGAKHAYFIENAKEAIGCIQDNLVFTKFMDRSTLIKQDVLSGLSLISEKQVDIIFMDPPYQAGIEESIFSVLQNQRYITEDTLVIAEADIKKDFSFLEDYGFAIVREKNYKTNKHVFIRKITE